MRRKFAFIGGDNLRTVDFWFLLIILVLVAFGLVMVFSASYYSSISVNGTPFYYLLRDGMWVFAGLIMMFIGMSVDYRVYKRFAVPIMLVCLATLVLVLVIGATRNGATRWLAIGPVTFMPGEWAKLGIIVFMAWFFGEKPARARSFFLGILPALIVTAGFAFLIIRQPNLSTALTVCGIAVAMMLVAGMHWAYVGGAAAVGIGGFLFIFLFMKDSYWYTRMTNFIDPFQDMYGKATRWPSPFWPWARADSPAWALARACRRACTCRNPRMTSSWPSSARSWALSASFFSWPSTAC